MVMSTVKKLKECDMVCTGGGEIPQGALDIRMMRDKPCESLRTMLQAEETARSASLKEREADVSKQSEDNQHVGNTANGDHTSYEVRER